jgi:porin
MANEVAQSGKNGPPIFPLGALGVRVKLISPDNQMYVQVALTDGVPGDPDNPRGTHVKLGNGDGSLSIVEFGLTPKVDNDNDGDDLNKLAIGVWRFTTQIDDLVKVDSNGDPLKKHSQGAYLLAEHTLSQEKDSAHNSTVFFRYGMASEDVHRADWSSSIGLHFHGFFAERNDDILGFAATVNHPSDAYKKSTSNVGTETDFELTYQAHVRPWLIVQPSLQYVVNPGMDKTIKNASVIGLRTEVHF